MVRQTCSWRYNNHCDNGYILTTLPTYLSVGPLSFCCSVIAFGIQGVIAAFIYKDLLRNQLPYSKRLWVASGRFLSAGRDLANWFKLYQHTIKCPSYHVVMYLRYLSFLEASVQVLFLSQLALTCNNRLLCRLGIALYRRPLSCCCVRPKVSLELSPHRCTVLRYPRFTPNVSATIR